VHRFLFSACICNYLTCNFDNIPGTLGCWQKGECLCLNGGNCCALSGDASDNTLSNPYPVGKIEDSSVICKLGLFCCACGLKVPSICCNGESSCLCCKGAAALPFADPVPEPVCALYGLRILPGPMGCGMPLKGGGSPPNGNNEMER